MPESELQRLCLDTLTGGAVQTYVDLIYLIAEGKTDVGTLTRVRAALVQAETSRRRGDTASVISSYADAARIFADKRNPRTSIYFLERSLDIAKLTNNHVAEMESYHLLGEAYEALGDAERALTFHEAHRELASTVGDSSEKAAAATQLVRVYTKQASDAEARGDTEVALKLYLAAADAAGASQQPATQLEPLYSAGKTFVGLGKAAEAIPLLQQYLNMCLTVEEERKNEAEAYAALAAAYLASADHVSAKKCFEAILASASAPLGMRVQALEHVGMILAQEGDPHAGLGFLEEAYTHRCDMLADGSSSRLALDKLRLVMGIVKARHVTSSHIAMMLQQSPAEILAWKTRYQAT